MSRWCRRRTLRLNSVLHNFVITVVKFPFLIKKKKKNFATKELATITFWRARSTTCKKEIQRQGRRKCFVMAESMATRWFWKLKAHLNPGFNPEKRRCYIETVQLINKPYPLLLNCRQLKKCSNKPETEEEMFILSNHFWQKGLHKRLCSLWSLRNG